MYRAWSRKACPAFTLLLQEVPWGNSQADGKFSQEVHRKGTVPCQGIGRKAAFRGEKRHYEATALYKAICKELIFERIMLHKGLWVLYMARTCIIVEYDNYHSFTSIRRAVEEKSSQRPCYMKICHALKFLNYQYNEVRPHQVLLHHEGAIKRPWLATQERDGHFLNPH